MGDRTAIEWTDATWNPVRGCTKVSAGCDNCYAMGVAHRFSGPGQPYEGLTRVIGGRGQWNGKVTLVSKILDQPVRWTRPRRIFVNSMSDLFHPDVPDEFIERVFAVMAKATQHQFQVLTKRPERMRDFVTGIGDMDPGPRARLLDPPWPLPNVWLGVSVEDQATADERIPILLDTPAAVRWISAEPLLGPIDLTDLVTNRTDTSEDHANCLECDVDIEDDPWGGACLDWVVVGGESGKDARVMVPGWARSLRDQCTAAGVPFLFKQWGEWAPVPDDEMPSELAESLEVEDKYWYLAGEHLVRVGKKRAGRDLDGRTWDEYP